MEPSVAPTTVDWNWLSGEVRTAAAEFADQLRSISDPGTSVPNLDWTVAELAAHIIALPDVYRSQDELGQSFVVPEDWNAFSSDSRCSITETNLALLADQLEQTVDGWLTELDPDGGGTRILYGQATTGKNITAGILTELLLHGLDLSAITGQKVTLTNDQALAVLPGLFSLVPAFIDAERAKRCVGIFHFGFRNGPDYTYRVDDQGKLTVSDGKPSGAAAHLIADPATFVMLSLGRVSQVKAALTGKVIAYGRKPWLLARLDAAKVAGV